MICDASRDHAAHFFREMQTTAYLISLAHGLVFIALSKELP